MESAIGNVKQSTVVSPAVNTTAQLASAAVGTGLAMSGVGTPVALAMQASQAVGSAVHGALLTDAQNSSGADYRANQNAWALGGNRAADNLYSSQQQRIANANSGASLGSLFGPIGALAGWFLGMQHSSQPGSEYKVGSFGGSVSASDSGVARSMNSDTATGQSTLQDTL